MSAEDRVASGRISEASRGVYVIAATPFAEDGALDLESTERLLDFYLECGVHGLTILGMMGEAPALTADETRALIEHVLRRVAGQVPVVVGVSSPGLRTMTAVARVSMEAGAAGVMIAPAPALRTDEQICAYFAAVFAELGPHIPVCLQDYPQSTGVHLSVPTLYRLADTFPQLVMFKHEDCPGLPKLTRIREEERGHRRLSILVGNGGLYYPQELRRGADGAMTGFAFPEMLVRVYELFRARDVDAAEDLFDLYLPLVRHEQQPGFGLAVRKEILRRRGIIRSATVRRPGPTLSAGDHAELDQLLARLAHRLAARAPELSPTMAH